MRSRATILAMLLIFGASGVAAAALANFEFEDLEIVDFDASPTIRLNYGVANLSFDDLDGSFAEPGLAEASLGFTDRKTSLSRSVLRYTYGGLSLGHFSTELTEEAEEDEIDARIWRGAMTEATGYGYRIRGSAITPYHAMGLAVSYLKVEHPIGNENDHALMNLYHNDYRFGSCTEGGLRINPGPTIELSTGFERQVIFRRWLFWKWVLSAALEHVTHGMLDEFIQEIAERSPLAAPIVHFALKNALSYGWYELRRDRMNWPFDTEAPIMVETFKVGVGFTF